MGRIIASSVVREHGTPLLSTSAHKVAMAKRMARAEGLALEIAPGSRTGYRGVSRSGRRYEARVSIQGNKVHVGNYETAEEAALALARRRARLGGSMLPLPARPASATHAAITKRITGGRPRHAARLPMAKEKRRPLSLELVPYSCALSSAASSAASSATSSTGTAECSSVSSPVEGSAERRAWSHASPARRQAAKPRVSRALPSADPLLSAAPSAAEERSPPPPAIELLDGSAGRRTLLGSPPRLCQQLSLSRTSACVGAAYQAAHLPDPTPRLAAPPPAPPPYCHCGLPAAWTRRRWHCARVSAPIGCALKPEVAADSTRRGCGLSLSPTDWRGQHAWPPRAPPERTPSAKIELLLAHSAAAALTAAAFPAKKPRRDPCMLTAESGKWDRMDREDWESMASSREREAEAWLARGGVKLRGLRRRSRAARR